MAGTSLSPNSLRLQPRKSPNSLLTPRRIPRRLPPLAVEILSTPRPPPPTPAPWSWYHRNCSYTSQPQHKQLHRRRQTTNKTAKSPKNKPDPEATKETLWAFLDENPDFLAHYVTFEVPATELEEWLRIKRQIDGTSPVTISPNSEDNRQLDYWVNHQHEIESNSPDTASSDDRNKAVTNSSQSEHSYQFARCHRYKGQSPAIEDDGYVSSNRLGLLPVSKSNVRTLEPPITEEPDVVSAGPSRQRRLLPTLIVIPQQYRVAAIAMVPLGATTAISAAEELITSILPSLKIEMYLVDNPNVYYLKPDDKMQRNLVYTSKDHSHFVRRAFSCAVQFMGPSDFQHYIDPPRHIVNNFNNNQFVAYVPVRLDSGRYVLEIWNEKEYSETDKELLRATSTVVSISLKYHSLYYSLLQESQMSAFLLEVAQAVFEDMVSLDQLIKKILEVAQRLVSADRASLFLVDYKNLQLVSTVFDLRYEHNQDSDFSKKEIRMPIDKGIAGHVAMSGETMNIPNAYSDQRFNKAVDEATGYRTVSILCMPIKVRGKVIAVVQMVNKRDKKAFEADDEAAFQVFSTFFGLALHNARLYDKIKRKEQKYKVALEVLGYHNTCAEEDVATILEERNKGEIINYNDFELNPFEVNEVEKCKGILTMFEDLFDVTKFDVAVLTRFVLTVKKNYRKVPYHNFDHGWSVANSMYVILKHDSDKRFDHKNRLALFVAALCHDLDHRGYTNKFMSDIESPLAAMYTTSTLEHHHFNMTVTILQQDGHNIFHQMSGEEYKDILDSIRHCILATDLAAFFPNLKRINELVFETPQFDWGEVSHRNLARSFCMTCADLCAASKPFEVQLCTVQIISAEFYLQGDLESAAGRTPIPMMDRSSPEELPACQVEFLTMICVPGYSVLQELFPKTKPMLQLVQANLESWKTRAAAVEKRKEK